MAYTRREFGKLTVAALPAVAVVRAESIFGAFAQAKPHSLIDGVQIGTITYSYRSMPDQSAEATLKYVVDSGISAIELMGGPVNDWARKKGQWDSSPAAPAAAAAAAGRGGRGGGGRGPAPTYPPVAGMKTGFWNCLPARMPTPRFNGWATGRSNTRCLPPTTHTSKGA